MKFNNEIIKIESVKIFNSYPVIKGKKINANKIEIIGNNIVFFIYTIVPFSSFNKLRLNEKTSIMDMIDNYDITLNTKEDIYINNENNSKVYFTKLMENTYKLNVEINNEEENINFKVEAIIDFNKIVK